MSETCLYCDGKITASDNHNDCRESFDREMDMYDADIRADFEREQEANQKLMNDLKKELTPESWSIIKSQLAQIEHAKLDIIQGDEATGCPSPSISTLGIESSLGQVLDDSKKVSEHKTIGAFHLPLGDGRYLKAPLWFS